MVPDLEAFWSPINYKLKRQLPFPCCPGKFGGNMQIDDWAREKILHLLYHHGLLESVDCAEKKACRVQMWESFFPTGYSWTLGWY